MAYRNREGKWIDQHGREMKRWQVYGDGRKDTLFAMASDEQAAIRACHNAGFSGMNRKAMAVIDGPFGLVSS